MNGESIACARWLPVVAMVTAGVWSSPAGAQVLVPVLPKDRVNVTVDAEVSFDAASNLFVYAYTVASDPTSEQEVRKFGVELDGTPRARVKTDDPVRII